MSPIWAVVTYLLLNGIAQGRKGFGPGEQEWGFVEVRPDAHMFWWLYYVSPPSGEIIDVYKKPLIIWLQGGPGVSSTGFGNFVLLGPLDLNENLRNHTWVNDYNVLFIDNPVGTGFSYVENTTNAYATTNKQIADDLLKCVTEFLNEFPCFQEVPTYVVGESYGGKMAAEFGLVWYKAQKEGSIRSNLKGVAFGDAWISPIDSMRSWAPFLLATGMVDKHTVQPLEDTVEKIEKAIADERWEEACDLFDYAQSAVMMPTGNFDFYNVVEKSFFSDDIRSVSENDILNHLMNNKVKEALGVDRPWQYDPNGPVWQYLTRDFMKPVDIIVQQLVNETDLEVYVYNGQLDVIVPTLGTMEWVERIFEGDEMWSAAPRNILVVDNVIEGYVKAYKNFKMCWINRAGHLVPKDNPRAATEMLQLMTSSK